MMNSLLYPKYYSYFITTRAFLGFGHTNDKQILWSVQETWWYEGWTSMLRTYDLTFETHNNDLQIMIVSKTS